MTCTNDQLEILMSIFGKDTFPTHDVELPEISTACFDALLHRLFDDKKWLGLIVAIDTFVSDDDLLPQGHYFKARALAAIGLENSDVEMMEESLKHFEIAIGHRVEPGSSSSWMVQMLLSLAQHSGEPVLVQEALSLEEKYMNEYGVNARSLVNMSSLCTTYGKMTGEGTYHKKALEYFEKSVALKAPNTADKWRHFAYVYLRVFWIDKDRRDLLKSAMHAIDKALAMEGSNAMSHFCKGQIYQELHKLGEYNSEEEAHQLLRSAVLHIEKAIALDYTFLPPYSCICSTLGALTKYEGSHLLYIALAYIMRGYSIDRKFSHDTRYLIFFLTENFHVPNFVIRLRAQYPILPLHPELEERLQYMRNAFLKQRNLLAQVLRELRKHYGGEELRVRFLFYRALAEHLGGDFVTAFTYHAGDLNTYFEGDLCHQYYFTLNAGNIMHESATLIQERAASFARQYLESGESEVQQSYYAANIIRLAGQTEEAAAILEKVHEAYWPASFKLAEFYDELDQPGKLKRLTKWIHENGRRNQFTDNPFSGHAAIKELAMLVQRHEIQNGWFISENFISEEEEKNKTKNIPLTRLKYSWDYTNDMGPYPNPSLEELAGLQPEMLKAIENLCRERLEDIFPYYEQTTAADPLRTAENLSSHMLAEYHSEKRVQFSDYACLLQYCYMKGKLSMNDYLSVSTFLNLKCSVMDKRKASGSLRQIISSTFTIIVSPMLQLVSETSLGMPLSLVIKVILDNAEKKVDEIRAMNYEYFLRNFTRLKDYTHDDLVEAIKAHKKYSNIKDLMDASVSQVF